MCIPRHIEKKKLKDMRIGTATRTHARNYGGKTRPHTTNTERYREKAGKLSRSGNLRKLNSKCDNAQDESRQSLTLWKFREIEFKVR